MQGQPNLFDRLRACGRDIGLARSTRESRESCQILHHSRLECHLELSVDFVVHHRSERHHGLHLERERVLRLDQMRQVRDDASRAQHLLPLVATNCERSNQVGADKLHVCCRRSFHVQQFVQPVHKVGGAETALLAGDAPDAQVEESGQHMGQQLVVVCLAQPKIVGSAYQRPNELICHAALVKALLNGIVARRSHRNLQREKGRYGRLAAMPQRQERRDELGEVRELQSVRVGVSASHARLQPVAPLESLTESATRQHRRHIRHPPRPLGLGGWRRLGRRPLLLGGHRIAAVAIPPRTHE
mmetsp:Transcript_20309/g.60669  ORF Transcript_20309/g.60669 Transcript_20309/m.60669 type:complete len:301 (+) Transcript_20309:423-1325(+)